MNNKDLSKLTLFAICIMFLSFPISITSAEISVVLLFLLSIRHLFSPEKTHISKNIIVGFIILIIGLLISVIFSVNRVISFKYLLKFWKIIIFIAVYYTIYKEETNFIKGINFYYLSLIIGIIVFIYERYLGGGVNIHYGFLRKSAMGMMILYGVFWNPFNLKAKEVWNAVVICSGIFILSLMGNKQNNIGIIVSLIPLYILKGYKKTVIFIALLFIIILFAFPGDISEYLEINTAIPSGSVLDRMAAWTKAVQKWKEYPITGIGLDNFDKIQFKFIWRVPTETKTGNISAHSMYVMFLVEGGIIGLSSFLLFIFFIMKEIISLRPLNNKSPEYNIWVALICSFTGFLITGIFNECFTDAEIFFLMFAFTFGSIAYLRKKSEQRRVL